MSARKWYGALHSLPKLPALLLAALLAGCAPPPEDDVSCVQLCSADHLTPTCSLGQCVGTCDRGWGDCNEDKQTDGCEVDLTSTAAHCGGCGLACSGDHVAAACSGGVCGGACAPGYADCDGNKRTNGCETQTTGSDTSNCGGCGLACSEDHVTPACTGGVCDGACAPGWFDCNQNKQTDGCESAQPCRICSVDGYCWENPLPQGNFLLAVWGQDSSQVWAVGYFGTILRWNGARWAAQPSGTTERLSAIWGSDASNIWVVGRSGTIRKWDGTAWTAQPSGTTNSLYGVWGTDANNVWAVGDSGTILKGDYDSPIRTYTDLRMEMSCRLPGSPT